MKIKILQSFTANQYITDNMQDVGLQLAPMEDAYDDCDFIYCGFNAGLNEPSISVKFGNIFSLLNKGSLPSLLFSCGVNNIDTYDATHENITTHFSNRPFILKPKVGFGSNTSKNVLEYKIFNNSADFLNQLTNSEEFFLNSGNNFIVQESVQRTDGSVKQLYCSGYIGLDGSIFHEGISTQIWYENTSDSSEDVIQRGTPKFVNLNTIRNAADKTDYLNFVSQIQTMVNHYQLKSTPFHIQALVNHDDTECFITDISFTFSNAITNYQTATDVNYLKDKMNFMYNGTPVSIQNNYWYSYQHFIPDTGIITQDHVNYGKTIEVESSFFNNDGWGKKSIPFAIRGISESDVLNKIQQFKTYIGMS